MIGIKVSKDYKNQIMKYSKELDMSVSEFVRNAVDNEISMNTLGQNQSFIYQVLESILTNILEQKLNAINQIIKVINIKQELIIELLKETSNSDLEETIQNFMTSYTSEFQLTTS